MNLRKIITDLENLYNEINHAENDTDELDTAVGDLGNYIDDLKKIADKPSGLRDYDEDNQT